MTRRPVVLTIAGLDPSGGAGVIADALRIAREKCHPEAVVTALTVQTPRGVERVTPVEPKVFRAQLRALVRDTPIAAAKTGLLTSAAHVRAIAEELPRRVPLVIDPVLASSGGVPFLDGRGLTAMVELLFPRAAIVTPNLDEAEAIAQVCVHSREGLEEAVRRLLAWGAPAVLVKGGHGGGRTVLDLFAQRRGARARLVEMRSKRLDAGAHGTGCALSAVIAARLAQGDSLERAVSVARARVRRDLRGAAPIGKGRRVLGL